MVLLITYHQALALLLCFSCTLCTKPPDPLEPATPGRTRRQQLLIGDASMGVNAAGSGGAHNETAITIPEEGSSSSSSDLGTNSSEISPASPRNTLIEDKPASHGKGWLQTMHGTVAKHYGRATDLAAAGWGHVSRTAGQVALSAKHFAQDLHRNLDAVLPAGAKACVDFNNDDARLKGAYEGSHTDAARFIISNRPQSGYRSMADVQDLIDERIRRASNRPCSSERCEKDDWDSLKAAMASQMSRFCVKTLRAHRQVEAIEESPFPERLPGKGPSQCEALHTMTQRKEDGTLDRKVRPEDIWDSMISCSQALTVAGADLSKKFVNAGWKNKEYQTKFATLFNTLDYLAGLGMTVALGDADKHASNTINSELADISDSLEGLNSMTIPVGEHVTPLSYRPRVSSVASMDDTDSQRVASESEEVGLVAAQPRVPGSGEHVTTLSYRPRASSVAPMDNTHSPRVASQSEEVASVAAHPHVSSDDGSEGSQEYAPNGEPLAKPLKNTRSPQESLEAEELLKRRKNRLAGMWELANHKNDNGTDALEAPQARQMAERYERKYGLGLA